mmetsp:Transcript_26632/g.87396  ORF Transcript_26632/g.87396 Transcript_26632/m.87396 type:complete len:203 (-) Transcript_26632:44-652(-)
MEPSQCRQRLHAHAAPHEDHRRLPHLPGRHQHLVGVHGEGDDVISMTGVEHLHVPLLAVYHSHRPHHVDQVPFLVVHEVVPAVVPSIPVHVLELQAVVRGLVCVHGLPPVLSRLLLHLPRVQLGVEIDSVLDVHLGGGPALHHLLLPRHHPLRLHHQHPRLVHLHLRLSSTEAQPQLVLHVRVHLVISCRHPLLHLHLILII